MADPISGMGDIIRCGCGCGTEIKQYDDQKRPRAYLRGHYLRAIVNAHRKQTVDALPSDAIEITTMR